MAVFDHPYAHDYQILIVEDNSPLRRLLKSSLENLGYRTTCVQSVADAYHALNETVFDLVLLDVVPPQEKSIDLCHSIRESSDIPIIALSVLNRTSDIVSLLEAGADEYITKPIQFDCLEATIYAQFRRYGGGSRTDLTPVYLDAGPLHLDIPQQTATIGKNSAQLSPRECRVLAYLMQRAGQPVSRAQIYQDIWGKFKSRGENRVAVTVHHLRAKLGSVAAHPSIITTVRGYGYKFDAIANQAMRYQQ